MSDVLKKIQTELKAFETKKKAFAKELKKDFPQIFLPLFEKSKRITSIGWTQYTPYFNDGEACEFSVNPDYLIINEEDSSDETDFLNEEVYRNGSYVKNPEFDKAEYKIVEEFKKIISSIPDEFMKEIFGDHVEVTINNKGKLKTCEYNHD